MLEERRKKDRKSFNLRKKDFLLTPQLSHMRKEEYTPAATARGTNSEYMLQFASLKIFDLLYL